MLDLTKTYRTRDGRYTGIRLLHNPDYVPWCRLNWIDAPKFQYQHPIPSSWREDGRWSYSEVADGPHNWDLIPEDEPAPAGPKPFRYEDCPIIDGKRIAEDQAGRKYALLCNDASGTAPIVGYEIAPDGYDLSAFVSTWQLDGTYIIGEQSTRDLRVPPKPKCTVWVNLYARRAAGWHVTEAIADSVSGAGRIGNRAYPIEIEEDA